MDLGLGKVGAVINGCRELVDQASRPEANPHAESAGNGRLAGGHRTNKPIGGNGSRCQGDADRPQISIPPRRYLWSLANCGDVQTINENLEGTTDEAAKWPTAHVGQAKANAEEELCTVANNVDPARRFFEIRLLVLCIFQKPVPAFSVAASGNEMTICGFEKSMHCARRLALTRLEKLCAPWRRLKEGGDFHFHS